MGVLLISTLSRREKNLLALLILTLIIVGGYYFVYRPLVKELGFLQTAIGEQEKSIGRSVELLQEKREMELEEEQLDNSYQEVLHLLPADKSVPTLILLLEEALVDRDIGLQSMQWLDTEEEEDYFIDSFQLKVRGQYGSIADFLESLRYLHRFVRCRAVSLTLDDTGDWAGADLLLEVFFIPAAGEDDDIG